MIDSFKFFDIFNENLILKKILQIVQHKRNYFKFTWPIRFLTNTGIHQNDSDEDDPEKNEFKDNCELFKIYSYQISHKILDSERF